MLLKSLNAYDLIIASYWIRWFKIPHEPGHIECGKKTAYFPQLDIVIMLQCRCGILLS